MNIRSLTIVTLFFAFLSCQQTQSTQSAEDHTTANKASEVKSYEACIKSGSIVVKIGDKTYCLRPDQILSNAQCDETAREKGKQNSNYNCSFINMILQPTNHILTFSKNKTRGTKDNPFDIEVHEEWGEKDITLGFGSALDINDQNMGCYHISDDSENGSFEIQFTSQFASMLKQLKNSK